jgi:hypothetical protein
MTTSGTLEAPGVFVFAHQSTRFSDTRAIAGALNQQDSKEKEE